MAMREVPASLKSAVAMELPTIVPQFHKSRRRRLVASATALRGSEAHTTNVAHSNHTLSPNRSMALSTFAEVSEAARLPRSRLPHPQQLTVRPSRSILRRPLGHIPCYHAMEPSVTSWRHHKDWHSADSLPPRSATAASAPHHSGYETPLQSAQFTSDCIRSPALLDYLNTKYGVGTDDVDHTAQHMDRVSHLSRPVPYSSAPQSPTATHEVADHTSSHIDKARYVSPPPRTQHQGALSPLPRIWSRGPRPRRVSPGGTLWPPSRTKSTHMNVLGTVSRTPSPVKRDPLPEFEMRATSALPRQDAPTKLPWPRSVSMTATLDASKHSRKPYRWQKSVLHERVPSDRRWAREHRKPVVEPAAPREWRRCTEVFRVGGGYVYLDEEGRLFRGSVPFRGEWTAAQAWAHGYNADGTRRTDAGWARERAEVAEILTDGTKVLRDGTRVLADGTRVLKDGTKVMKDGTRVLKDGTRVMKDGSLIAADHSQAKKFNEAWSEQEAWEQGFNADGTQRTDQGRLTELNAEGLLGESAVLADETTLLADGSKVSGDGGVVCVLSLMCVRC